jgi:predicted transcriptional regulator
MNNEEWQKLREKSKKMTNDEYSAEVSSIIRLTKNEISAIVTEAAIDKDKLSELIAVVNDAAKSNTQKAEDIRNTTGFAEVAASLIGKLV